MSIEAQQALVFDLSIDIPQVVECPCDDGYAEQLPTPIIEPAGNGSNRKKATYSYRHEGCYVGGHIVVVDGRITGRYGPLFNPRQYSDRAFSLDDKIKPLNESTFPDEQRITDEAVGKRLVEIAEEHSNRAAAVYFNVPYHVVDYHRYKDPVYNQDITITSELCNLMREMAADGCLYPEIASVVGCGKTTVMNHVSSTGGSSCSHDVTASRVDMKDSMKKVDHELCKELRRRVAGGESCSDLASEFGISKRTVNRHVSSSIKQSWKCKHNTVPRINLIERRKR